MLFGLGEFKGRGLLKLLFLAGKVKLIAPTFIPPAVFPALEFPLGTKAGASIPKF